MIDAHTHLDFPEFDPDRDAVVARARAAGVDSWIVCGSDHTDWDRTVRVAADTGGTAWLGVHPWETATLADETPWLEQLRARRPAGIGEIGLDALWAKTPEARANQRRCLRSQLALARELDLPVAIHCVRAYPELVVLLERDGVPARGGMVHAWSGPAELVDRVVALGLHVSFALMVVRDRARKARESVPRVPDHALLVETDCPSMAPPGSDRGEPAHLVHVVREVAALRGKDESAIRSITAENATRLIAG